MITGKWRLLLEYVLGLLTGSWEGFEKERARQKGLVDSGAEQQRKADRTEEDRIVTEAEKQADATAQASDDANRNRLRQRVRAQYDRPDGGQGDG